MAGRVIERTRSIIIIVDIIFLVLLLCQFNMLSPSSLFIVYMKGSVTYGQFYLHKLTNYICPMVKL